MGKIIVVGGGVSGLSAGIYGRLLGHEVTILERHAVAGGNLTGWRRGGFTIDNCVHWLTGTNPKSSLYPMWVELGVLGDTEIVRCDSLYTYLSDDGRISLCRDLSRLEDEMIKASAEDASETRSLMRGVRAMQGISGIGGEDHSRRARVSELISASPALIRYAASSCGEVARRFRSRLLSGFIRSFLGDDFSAMALLFVFAHFTAGNADLTRGGSIAMADRMRDRFLGLGGQLMLRAEVTKIRHTRGVADAAILADGREIEGDYFIFCCDPKPAFERLLSLPLPPGLDARYKRKNLHRFSGLHAAFAVDGEDLPFSGDLIFALPKKYRGRLHSEHLIIREFSHERSFSPRGGSLIQAVTFIDEEASMEFIGLRKRNPLAYKDQKQRLAELMKDAIEGRMPELRGRLRLIDSWSPASYERYTGAECGSFMSFTLPKAYYPSKISPKIPGLKNVILATQWQQAPGGLPTAAMLGRDAARLIGKASEQRSYSGKILRGKPAKEI